VVSADFARSGFQSLAVTNRLNNNLKVYLATGSAAFGPAFTYPTCLRPTAAVSLDVDGDGYPDIAVVCPTSNTLDIFLNQGAASPGSFNSAIPFTVTNPVALASGKFSITATSGLAVVSGTGGVAIFQNVGGSLVVTTASVSGTLTGVTAADFNHDGKLDLAISDSANNNVHVLLNNGTGNFTLAGNYGTGGTSPSGIVSADFNHDGNMDVATSNAGSNNVTILLGSASGTLTAQTPVSAGTNPVALVTTDVNSDGNPDLVAFDNVTASTGAYSVLLGNGDGTLQTAQTVTQTNTHGSIATVSDFNRDGKPDVADAQSSVNTVAVRLNNTLPTVYPYGRSFSSVNAVSTANGNMADSITAADFNQDGYPDIAVSYLADNAVRVMLNNGSGFSTAATYSVGKQPYSVVSGDLNGDGYADLVTANTGDNTVSVLLNNGNGGNGTFAAATSYTVGKQPYGVAIGDINHDGYPDLVVANNGSDTVSILLGSANGTFTPSATTLATCANPYGIALGDFQHNGYPSVAVTCYSANELEVFPNNGNGTFGSPFITATDKNPGPIVVADFNRDSKLDIVVGNTIANNIYFFAGNGDNTFKPGVMSPSLNFPSSIAAADINGDGILDIVGVAPNYNSVIVTLGVGDGTFGTFQQRAAGQFSAVKQPWGVALADFNQDGKIDIVTANTYNQVNIASPAYQARYLAQYPAIPGGHPSVDLLYNQSGAFISVTANPASPLPFNNSGTTITATVQPSYSGVTPTGSVLFEDATGAPLGTGAYPLSGGSVSIPTGRLGSGQYQFTTLYSGDANYQPTTLSGNAVTVVVTGTPVTLTVTPASVSYANSFTVTATVAGSSPVPAGTVTVYGTNSGGTTFTLGTITLAGGTGTGTYNAVGPNLNVGTYQIYGYYNSSNGYPPGSSANQTLTVTGEPTTLALSCGFGLLSVPCTATVTASTTNTPVPAGNIVNFTVNGGSPTTETIGANGQANFSFNEIVGTFTVVATFPQQSNYLASSNSTSGGCIIICLFQGTPFSTLDSFTGLQGGFPGARANAFRNRNRYQPFSIF
jgi:hypothetical protein